MTLGIMQPYLFPYIGYFQNIAAVDKFVLYDDVAFIRQGWINRNNILLQEKSFLFTVPVRDTSSNRLINDTEINTEQYILWRDKFYRTLEQAYKKAPHYSIVSALVKQVLESEQDNISNLAGNSIKSVCDYLNINTPLVYSSVLYQNQDLNGQERVIDTCKLESADRYINPKGGMHLYDKKDFKDQGIILEFLAAREVKYTQLTNEFVPWLSIIDVLMFNDIESARSLLTEFELL